MTHPLGPIRLLVHGRARPRGELRHALPRLRAALDERGLRHDVVVASSRAEAEAAATAALREDRRYLVAVGGDGFVGDVVNGMFADRAPIAPDAVLGVVPLRERDFARTFGLDRDVDVLVRHLASEHVMPVDVALARFAGRGGRQAERLFVNIAEVGYGAEALRLAGRLPRRLGGLRALLAAWGAIAATRRQEAVVRVAHTDASVPVVEVVVANGQFFGDGMKVAPRALPDDGLFNVQIFTGQRSQVFLLTSRIYRGEHLPHPQIVEYQSPSVELAPPEPLRVAADRRLLGTTPASFSLLPRALRLKI